MKTLLNKKLAIVLAAFGLFTSMTNAQQIPDKLRDLPAFKLRASILSSLHKPHAHSILNDLRCSINAPCLKAQNTLGGSGDDFTDKLKPSGRKT